MLGESLRSIRDDLMLIEDGSNSVGAICEALWRFAATQSLKRSASQGGTAKSLFSYRGLILHLATSYTIAIFRFELSTTIPTILDVIVI